MGNQFSEKAVEKLFRHVRIGHIEVATFFWHLAERSGEDLTEARIQIRVKLEEEFEEHWEKRGIDIEDNYTFCIGELLAVSKLFGIDVSDLLVRYAKSSHNFATPLHRKSHEDLALAFFAVPTAE